ncbi:calcium-binding protein, partial [Phaeobacter sp. B1627]|uniref:calcium-binding protein n=1 Tax=Phaeobacter sp. B1627 TaxID=2583809 RepID=UPI001118D177
DYNRGNDKVTFTDVNATDVVLSRIHNDVIFTLPSGETITLIHQLNTDTRNSLESFEFADGEIWNQAQMRNRLMHDMKATGEVIGTENDEFYTHAAGDGSYSITDYDYHRGADRLTFSDLNETDVTLSRDGNSVVFETSGGEQITLNSQLDGDSRRSIETFEFANGTTWDQADLRSRLMDDMKAGGAVIGTEFDERYVHRAADGSYTITDYDYHRGDDVLVFADHARSQVSAKRDGANAVFTVAGGATVTILGQFNTDLRNSVESIEFDDGTIWDFNALLNGIAHDMKATGSVVGSVWSETFRHTLGDGSYSITGPQNLSGHADRLIFTDATSDQAIVTQDGNNAVISLSNGETITLIGQFAENPAWTVPTVEFADGVIFNDLRELEPVDDGAIEGGDATDVVSGSGGSDILRGLAGNDV